LGAPKHDGHGRVITLEYEAFHMVLAYVPNSGQNLERLEYRIKEWEPDMIAHLKVGPSLVLLLPQRCQPPVMEAAYAGVCLFQLSL
jgi:hypothetical protein